MRPVRRLGLRRETLHDLTPADLGLVGGAAPTGVDCKLTPVCASILEPCITWGLCTTY